MHNPPHPGQFIKEICLKPRGLSIAKGADFLGVDRKNLSRIINGEVGIKPIMAIKLAKAFNTTAESWLIQQMNYDLWKANERLNNCVHDYGYEHGSLYLTCNKCGKPK